MTAPRPKAWHLIFAALFGAFELVMLYLVLHPNVADDYRAYYIDRTASCFPRITSGYYPLGQAVTFVGGRNGYARDTLRLCGFMPANNMGIRSFGDYGILKLSFPVPDNDLLLSFTSFANTGADRPVREVKVVVNGERLATLTYNSPKQVAGRIVIPEAVAKKGKGGLEIRFEVPRIGPPGTNSEPVTLQLRLEALRVVPVGEGPASAPGQKKEAGWLPPLKTRASGTTWRRP